jgi:hypothetical protein
MDFYTGKPTVGCILDEFSYLCFEPECAQLISLHPATWKRTLHETKFDFILCESAWKAYGSGFSMGTRDPAKKDLVYLFLKELTSCSKDLKIPTVFWNKEDDKHYYHFKKYAALFEHVFTTDSRTLSWYKKSCPKAKSIDVLTFAIQPLLHNPIRPSNSFHNYYKGDAFFAGSWYKFPERARDLDQLLTIPSNIVFHIYDRHFSDTKKTNFPKKFHRFLRKGISYKEMVEAYKQYPIMFSVNTVKGSSTMYSRRVPEALACGTNVICTPSKALRKFFGTFLYFSNNQAITVKSIASILANPARSKVNTHLARRELLSKHTYFHRMRKICKTLKLPLPDYRKGVFILCIDPTRKLKEQLALQTYKYILGTHCINFNDEAKTKNVISDLFLRRMLPNNQVDEELGFVAIMYSSSDYDPNYLLDQIQSFHFANNADIIGKSCVSYKNEHSKETIIHPQKEHVYNEPLHPHTLIFNLSKDESIRKNRMNYLLRHLGDLSIPQEVFTFYSADRYNFRHCHQ